MNSKDYECPVCFEYMLEEISMCDYGHNICQKCRKNIKTGNCPTCRERFIKGRNLVLEKIIGNTPLVCKNEGCGLLLTGNNMLHHNKNCAFQDIPCIMSIHGCVWKGQFKDLKKHINLKHKDRINHWGGSDPNDTYLVLQFKDLFVVNYKFGPEHVTASCMKMGFSNEPAKNYKFKLEYDDETHRGYKIVIEAPCILRCRYEEVFNSDFVCLPNKMVNKLAKNVKEGVPVGVFIEKINDN